ncbi:MAG: DMT family transporter [Nitrospinota bacterium]
MTLLWAVLCGFLFGLGDIITRLGVRTATPYTGAFTNSIAMSVSLGIFVLARGVGSANLWPAVGWFALAGAAGLAPGRLLYYMSVQRIGVSRASVLNSLTPFIGILMAVGFLGERPTWLILLGTVFIVGGIIGLVTDRQASRIPLTIALYGITPTFFFSLIPIFMRLGMQSLPDPILGTSVSFLAAILALLAGQFLLPRKSRWAADRRAIWIFLLAGICLGSAFITFYKALTIGTVSFVMPLVYTSPLFAILISRLLLQKLEQVTWRLAAGAVAVFLGVLLVSMSRGG